MPSFLRRWFQRHADTAESSDSSSPEKRPDEPDPQDDQPSAAEGGSKSATAVRATEEPSHATSSAQKVTVDRGAVIGSGVRATAAWCLRLIVIGVAAALAYWLLGKVWVGVRPILLAIILSTVLWPPTGWLQRHRWPPALAAITVLVLALAVAGGVLFAGGRPIATQSANLANSAADAIQRLQDWAAGPPLNLSDERLSNLIGTTVNWLRNSATEIAGGVVTGVSVVSSLVVTAVLVLVLAFFFIKDGPAFLPWLRRWSGPAIGGHLTEVLTRSWQTLSSFIRVQALVSLVDAVFIGLGLVIMQVPLAVALALLTFVAGFIPIVGAVTAGALAVLIALVSNGLSTALIVLGIILLVQQLESNVLQPFLQGRSMNLHAAVVLLAVTAGGTLYGIIGAFLAVPFAAVAATVLRYVSEQIALRAGEMRADDVTADTAEGRVAARKGEQDGARNVMRWRRRRDEQTS